MQKIGIGLLGFGNVGSGVVRTLLKNADLIADRILGRADDPHRINRVRSGEGATRLRSTPWIDPEDLERCLKIDRFSFALRAGIEDGIRTLRGVRGPESGLNV